MHICISMCIYIYVYREREREIMYLFKSDIYYLCSITRQTSGTCCTTYLHEDLVKQRKYENDENHNKKTVLDK